MKKVKKLFKILQIAQGTQQYKKNNDFCIKMAEVLGVPVLS